MENTILDALIKNGGIVAGITVVYFIIKLFMNGKGRKNEVIPHGYNTESHSVDYINTVKEAMGKVDDLHKWHQPDSTGVQEWKNPNLADAITNLAKSIDKQSELHTRHTSEQTRVMQSMCTLLTNSTTKIDTIHNKINKS